MVGISEFAIQTLGELGDGNAFVALKHGNRFLEGWSKGGFAFAVAAGALDCYRSHRCECNTRLINLSQ